VVWGVCILEVMIVLASYLLLFQGHGAGPRAF